MKARATLRLLSGLTVAFATVLAMQALVTEVQANNPGRKCPRGIRSCSASQVGQPCDPTNLSVLCSAQANGSYCCLAYAP